MEFRRLQEVSNFGFRSRWHRVGSARLGSARPGPVRLGSARLGAARPGPARGRPEPSRAEPSQAEPIRAGPGRARAEPSRDEPQSCILSPPCPQKHSKTGAAQTRNKPKCAQHAKTASKRFESFVFVQDPSFFFHGVGMPKRWVHRAGVNGPPPYIYIYIGVRGSLERDISSLRALGPGGVQISRVVHVSARAAFGVFADKNVFLLMHKIRYLL